MFYSDDPARDFDRMDQELERRRARRPICSECGEHIMEETAYCKDGVWICDKCIELNKTWIDDYE